MDLNSLAGESSCRSLGPIADLDPVGSADLVGPEVLLVPGAPADLAGPADPG